MALARGLQARGSFPGPLAGGYNTFVFTADALANAETRIYVVVCPADCRIMEVSVHAVTTTSDPTYAVSNGAAGGTDVIAARNMPASSTPETITPTSTPALANRNFNKGDELTLTLVADAGDALVDFTGTITVFYTDHVVASPAND